MRVLQEDGSCLEFNRIDSVERVYKVLREYLDADVSRRFTRVHFKGFWGVSEGFGGGGVPVERELNRSPTR